MPNQAKTNSLSGIYKIKPNWMRSFFALVRQTLICRSVVLRGILTVLSGFVPTSLALAASISRVNADHSKIILKLSAQELSAVEVGDLLLFAFGKEAFFASGRIDRIDVVKASAMVVLPQPDPRLTKQQSVQILPIFSNPMRSFSIRALTQYHPYRSPGVEAQAGMFGSELRQRMDGATVRTRSLGRIFAAQTHLPVYPESFGLGLGYEHRGITNFVAQVGDDATSNFSFDRVEPAFWFQPESNLRLALRYDFSSLTVASGGGVDGLTYDFVFYQPHFAILWFDRDFEIGFDYRHRAEFTASDTDRLRNTTATPQQQHRVQAAELDLYARLASTSGLVWGGRLGGVFYERVTTAGGFAEAKPKPYEMLRAAASLEHRIADGAKLDYELSASGALVPNLATEPRGINTLGFTVSYYQILESGLWVGGLGEIMAGKRVDRVPVIDQETAEIEKKSRRSVGGQLRLQLIARYDLSQKRR